jgi:CRP-like cAMP-binding protein
MDVNAKHLDLLAATALFSQLSRQRLETVGKLAREMEHEAGDVVVTEGNTAHGLQLIIEGTAEVSIGGTPVAELGPGDSFGEIALLDAGPRTATVSAKTPMRVLAISGAGFRDVLRADPDLAGGVIDHLVDLVREMDAQIADFRARGSFA